MNIPDDLQPGDILLYFSADLVDEVIAWKEGDVHDLQRVGHVEIYAGAGQSWASRNGIGVDTYPFRTAGLVMVRRPIGPFNALAAKSLADRLKGTPYGMGDNLADAGIESSLAGVNCSHYGTLIEHAGLCPQFASDFPPREITPRDFQTTRQATTLYVVN